jgi:hypothetical protein
MRLKPVESSSMRQVMIRGSWHSTQRSVVRPLFRRGLCLHEELVLELYARHSYRSTTGRTSTAPPMRAAGIRAASATAASMWVASTT